MELFFKTKLFLLSICTLCLISCNVNSPSIKILKNNIIEIEKQIKHDSTGIENFTSFFEFFKQDTTFQFERTYPPYIIKVFFVTINAAGDMRDTTITSFDKDQWIYASWVSDKPKKIEIKSDSVILSFIDSVYVREVLSDYIFVRMKNKWYFKALDIKQLPYIPL